jgi:hypothetical protein
MVPAMRSTRETRLPRRTTDRFEDAVAWLLAAIALLGLGAALAAGLSEFATGMERGRAEAATRTPATATLVADAPRAAESPTGIPQVRTPATVTWTAPDGTRGVGTVIVSVGAREGATIPIWLTADGALAGAPTTAAAATGAGLVTGLAVLTLDACVVATAWWATRRATLAVNARAWD